MLCLCRGRKSHECTQVLGGMAAMGTHLPLAETRRCQVQIYLDLSAEAS